MKIQILSSEKHIGMLGIKTKLVREGLLSYIEN
jgi:hypothetical protein